MRVGREGGRARRAGVAGGGRGWTAGRPAGRSARGGGAGGRSGHGGGGEADWCGGGGRQPGPAGLCRCRAARTQRRPCPPSPLRRRRPRARRPRSHPLSAAGHSWTCYEQSLQHRLEWWLWFEFYLPLLLTTVTEVWKQTQESPSSPIQHQCRVWASRLGQYLFRRRSTQRQEQLAGSIRAKLLYPIHGA